MEEFRFLYTTKFNNKRFWVLSNENYRVYILEILENGKLCYPEYDDYIGFVRKFKDFSSGKQNFRWNFNKKNNTETNAHTSSRPPKGVWSFFPGVVKKGIIISAIVALGLAGLAIGLEIGELITEQSQARTIETYMNVAQKNGYEVEYESELNKYIVKSYIDAETNEKVIVCTTNDELKAYFPNKNQNPTYEDVIKTIQQNENIPDEFKEQYIAALKQLKELMPGIDLFVLNLNAERMSVREVEDLENASGLFHTKTGEIEYVENPRVLTVVHELAHSMFGGEFRLPNGDIVNKTFKIPELKFNFAQEEKKMYIQLDFHGVTTEEYLADKIGEILTGEKKDGHDNSYSPTNWHWEMYRLACDYSYQDLTNNGCMGFAYEMLENDVGDPGYIMSSEDDLLMRAEGEIDKYAQSEITINSAAENFWADWLDEKVQRGESGLDERIVECITGAGYTEGVSYRRIDWDTYEVITLDSSTQQELVEEVTTFLHKLESKQYNIIPKLFEDDGR